MSIRTLLMFAVKAYYKTNLKTYGFLEDTDYKMVTSRKIPRIYTRSATSLHRSFHAPTPAVPRAFTTLTRTYTRFPWTYTRFPQTYTMDSIRKCREISTELHPDPHRRRLWSRFCHGTTPAHSRKFPRNYTKPPVSGLKSHSGSGHIPHRFSGCQTHSGYVSVNAGKSVT